MNQINAAKLHLSKWTATRPQNREKHFIVTRVLTDDAGDVQQCIIEAVHSRREELIDWRDLRQADKWRQGWL